MTFRLFAVFAALAVAAPSLAQTPAQPTAGFDNGFFIQTPDGSTRLEFGFTGQADGRFSVDTPLPITNTFTIRKIRPALSGRLTKYFEFKVMPDLGSGTTVLQDAYLDTRFSPRFRVRVGKDKTPVGYELLVGDPNLWFPERALTSSLVPNRDIGVQARGDVAGGRLTYAAGLFNGVPDATSATTEVDTNSDKDAAGRIVIQPWRRAQNPGALAGLGVHIGASYGDQTGALPSFKTSVGQTYFAYATGVTANGRRRRVSPAVFYNYKSFGMFGEYALSTQDVARAGAVTEVDNHAVDVNVSYFLTGESNGVGAARPKRPFDPASGAWGALQVLTRYSHLEIDGDVFGNGLAVAGASRRADQWTGAVNWFPNQFIKWYVTYERTTFDKGAAGSRAIENVILFRTQVAF
ncbi:MAG TPA: porin [Vicinamibacterales bacterium]|jgi:phosphate-selective porin OprO/OprP|nr:porin [Vicinamibacterales bacterium]